MHQNVDHVVVSLKYDRNSLHLGWYLVWWLVLQIKKGNSTKYIIGALFS